MLKIGSVLKQTRLEKRMTLEDLSSKCGYSKALISRIENNSVSPSIASLTKISETLDLKLYDIFANVDVDEPAILRNEERQKFSVRDGKYEIEFLTTSLPSKMMQPLLVSLKSGSDSGKGTDLHNGEEFLLVLKGKAEILVGENRYILRQGDSIYFKSSIPHRYKSIGKGKTVSLAVTYPPYY
jgi:transcriptional regulator with XRE-family HTH domain